MLVADVTVEQAAYEEINFAGGKSGNGGEGSYSSPAQPTQGYSRPAAAAQPAPSFSVGSNDDFAVIDDNEDLPF